jgi:hypothetical protein
LGTRHTEPEEAPGKRARNLMKNLTGANEENRVLTLHKETKGTKRGQMTESWQDRILNSDARKFAQAASNMNVGSAEKTGR